VYRKILVPTDGPKLPQRAVEHAIELETVLVEATEVYRVSSGRP
jgi:nucleotide-binding universal stress UspA family protein